MTNIQPTLALGQDLMTKAPVQAASVMTQRVAESYVYCGGSTLLTSVQVIQLQFCILGIKLVKETRRITSSQTHTTQSGKTI